MTRFSDQIAGVLAAAYGSPEKAAGLHPRLPLIRDALQEGDHCRAMILAVPARLTPVEPEGIERLARTEALAKIQKYGDRHFRDPRSILLPDDQDHI